MAFDLDNLEGHLGEVLLNTRKITDPWGFGITAEITSSNAPEWRQYELELAANSPGSEKIRRAAAQSAVAALDVSGFRKAKALTAGERRKKMEDELAKPGEVTIDIVDLRKKKEGIARIIVRSMGGLTKGGQPVDLSTAEARLKVMGHEQYEFTDSVDGQTKVRTIPMYKKKPDGSQELDGAGEPVEMPYGGMNIGDALAQWPLDEAGELALFVEQKRAQALEPSRPGSTGASGTGDVALPEPELS
jgi:hypothetical protein